MRRIDDWVLVVPEKEGRDSVGFLGCCVRRRSSAGPGHPSRPGVQVAGLVSAADGCGEFSGEDMRAQTTINCHAPIQVASSRSRPCKGAHGGERMCQWGAGEGKRSRFRAGKGAGVQGGCSYRSRKEDTATGSRVVEASRMGGPRCKHGLPLRLPNFTS